MFKHIARIVPNENIVPISMVTGRSVLGLRVKQGTFKIVVSS